MDKGRAKDSVTRERKTNRERERERERERDREREGARRDRKGETGFRVTLREREFLEHIDHP